MRFLYSLGFDKESYINPKGKENWRFKKSEKLTGSIGFLFFICEIKINKELVICQRKI